MTDLPHYPIELPPGDRRDIALRAFAERLAREAAMRAGPPTPERIALERAVLANERVLLGRQVTRLR